MTVQQLHTGLELALQQVNSNLFNRLEPEEKDYYLNEGVNLYLTSLLEFRSDNNVLSYTDIMSRYSKIHTLIDKIELNKQGSGFVLGSDWFHIFRIDAFKNNKLIPVRILTNEDVTGDTNDSYGASSFSYIGEIYNNKIIITPDNVSEIEIIFVKQPRLIDFKANITSDLPTKTHYDIVNVAASNVISKYISKNAAATGQVPQNKQ